MAPVELEILIGARHKERTLLCEGVESSAIDIATVDPLRRPSFGKDIVPDVGVTHAAGRDADQYRNAAPKVRWRKT